MTEGQTANDTQPAPARRPSLDELARAQGIKPIESFEDLETFALDVWDSDEDLEAFLADVRASRNADLARLGCRSSYSTPMPPRAYIAKTSIASTLGT